MAGVTYLIYKNLAELNDLYREDAMKTMLDCCGSGRWAECMVDARPFRTLEHLFHEAEETWFALTTVDHLEAFAAHPKIGEPKAAATQQRRSAEWSSTEQGGIDRADDDTRAALAEINRLYQEKFGFIFIVCATGKTADEMLEIAKARIRNSVETELKIAAEEQNKITRLRLEKLLEK
ncbi:MAG: 2-oxo-4-hydroxy-4-carboxy-5-ureidoimidazoline decarboxylase [Pyrinomonadaceae bacterium]